MSKGDVIVIGGGLAGLTAALAAAKSGKSVMLLAKGAGTLAFGGGVIDVLGYHEGRLVTRPREVLPKLPDSHPYKAAGAQAVTDAMEFISRFCADAGYPLDGSLDNNLLIPTAAGTFKPSCLAPKTMNASDIKEARVITVVGFAGLKDFYPRLVINGLREMAAYRDKEFRTVTIQTHLPGGRDISALDIARWLDSTEGQQEVLRQLKACVAAGSYLLLPPVLGTEPSYDLWQRFQQQLGSRMVELAAPPPAITGSRLRTLFMRALKQQGIRLIEQAHVRRAECHGDRCTAVITRHLDRERRYEAQSFIVATGGFLGGGLTATPQGLQETVFDLPVTPSRFDRSQCGSLFAKSLLFSAGIQVDAYLRPRGTDGRTLLTNVYIAGNLLAGYDYCSEKSGNGVAVVSGFHAAQSITRRE